MSAGAAEMGVNAARTNVGKTNVGKMNAGKGIVVFGVFLLAALWVGIFVNLSDVRNRVLTDAGADTANLTRVFDEHMQRTIAGLDQSLLYLRAEYQADPDAFDLNQSIANNVILKRISVQIAWIDADGMLADSNVPGFKRMDLSDREHFRVHLDGKDALFVSKPVLGRASGKWSVQLTRRLETKSGSFAGVLVISMDPLYLADFYASVNVGADGAVALVGRDGIVRAASQNSDFLGRTLPAGPVMDAVRTGRATSLVAAGPLDDVNRILSVRPLPGLPLAVLVGRSEAEVLTVYQDAKLLHLIGGGSVTVVLGAALLVLYRMVRNQESIARDLAVKKAELLAGRQRLRRYVADLERVAEVAAHDLQEPLRRVVAYSQLLSRHVDADLDDEGRRYVAHVVEGAQRMRKLVKDLESFVAVDHMPAADQPVSAAAAVAVALERLEEKIAKTGASVVIDALPLVCADDKALTEVFTQLLDNAVSYCCADRKPMVHVGWHSESDVAIITVRDNGRGIELRDRVHLFELFHRVAPAGDETTPDMGTGIGLAIVRRIIERLHGKVSVESVPGSGSAFSFTLPMPARTGALSHGGALAA